MVAICMDGIQEPSGLDLSFCGRALLANGRGLRGSATAGLLDGHSRVRRWEVALHAFVDPGSGFEFNAALQACAVGAKPGWAVDLLRDLRQSGYQADAVAWTTTLTASRRHWKLTMGLFTQLRREVDWLRDNLAESKEPAAAVLFWLSHRLRSATNAALTSCMLHRRWQHSLDLARALGRFATQPNEITYTTCFAAISDSCGPAAAWELTVQLLQNCLLLRCSGRDASLLADAAARSAARSADALLKLLHTCSQSSALVGPSEWMIVAVYQEWEVALALLGADWRGQLQDAALYPGWD